MQAIRFHNWGSRSGDFKLRDGRLLWWQPSRQEWVALGDVIELMEERSNPNEVRRRWVSEWEAVDGD